MPNFYERVITEDRQRGGLGVLQRHLLPLPQVVGVRLLVAAPGPSASRCRARTPRASCLACWACSSASHQRAAPSGRSLSSPVTLAQQGHRRPYTRHRPTPAGDLCQDLPKK